MEIRNRRALKREAAEALAANPGNPRLLAIIFVAIMAAGSLLVPAVNLLLNTQIANTGGLDAMKLRSVLGTIQTMLPMACNLFTLGIQMGFSYAALCILRRREAGPRTLLKGFSWFAPMIRWKLAQILLYSGIGLCVIYPATIIFQLTPLSADMNAIISRAAEDPQAFVNALNTDPAVYNELFMAALPVLPIFLVLFLIVAAPFFYQYRFTCYCLLDAPQAGALAAMGESARMLKGHRLQLLKLDLSYWWAYLGSTALAVVVLLICQLVLIRMHVTLTSEAYMLIMLAGSMIAQWGFLGFFVNRMECTYAAAYESLRPRSQSQPSQGAVLGNIFDLAKEYLEENRE